MTRPRTSLFDLDLERILRTRSQPPLPPEDLPRRILQAIQCASAPATEPYKTGLWDSLTACFIIPRPAFALAASLFLGIFAGTGIDLTNRQTEWDVLASEESPIEPDMWDEDLWEDSP